MAAFALRVWQRGWEDKQALVLGRTVFRPLGTFQMLWPEYVADFRLYTCTTVLPSSLGSIDVTAGYHSLCDSVVLWKQAKTEPLPHGVQFNGANKWKAITHFLNHNARYSVMSYYSAPCTTSPSVYPSLGRSRSTHHDGRASVKGLLPRLSGGGWPLLSLPDSLVCCFSSLFS